jgi:hypothetical protein
MLPVQGLEIVYVADVVAMSLPVCTSFFLVSFPNLTALLRQLSHMQTETDLFNLVRS